MNCDQSIRLDSSSLIPIRFQSFDSLSRVSLAFLPNALRVVSAMIRRVNRSFDAAEMKLSMSGFWMLWFGA